MSDGGYTARGPSWVDIYLGDRQTPLLAFLDSSALETKHKRCLLVTDVQQFQHNGTVPYFLCTCPPSSSPCPFKKLSDSASEA